MTNSKKDTLLIFSVVSILEPDSTCIIWGISHIMRFYQRLVLTRKIEGLLICFNLVRKIMEQQFALSRDKCLGSVRLPVEYYQNFDQSDIYDGDRLLSSYGGKYLCIRGKDFKKDNVFNDIYPFLCYHYKI
jgi:hypothetical protein